MRETGQEVAGQDYGRITERPLEGGDQGRNGMVMIYFII